LTSWKNSRVSRKVLILTACFAKQVRFPFFIGASRFWNSLLSSNNPLLEKIVRADLLLANRSDTWTHQVLHALQDSPASHRLLNAIQSCESVILKQFKLTVREHFIGDWREIDNLTPREAHHSSKVMRTYHTHFGVPLGIAPGWWDDRKRVISLSTFAWTFPAIFAVHFLAFAFLATTFWSKECVMTRTEGLTRPDLWQMWLAHCPVWGTYFAGLSAGASGQPTHSAPACLPTSVWG
jgi:hypothetical protein